MTRVGFLAAGFAATLALAASQAKASTWMLNNVSTGGAPMTADLTLTAADTLNAVGGFDVNGLSGAVNGDAVTRLLANPSQPPWSHSADGLFVIENVFFQAAPHVSSYGLFFAGASANEYNPFSDNASTNELYPVQSGVGYLANSAGTLAIAAAFPPERNPLLGGVPEPATWALMIVGFGAVGAQLRRRRNRAALA